MFKFNKKNILFALGLLSVSTHSVYAQTDNKHVIVAPPCLIKNLNSPYQTLSSNTALSLVSVSDEGIDQLIEAKNNHKVLCGGFMDVTEAWNKQRSKKLSAEKNAQSFLDNYTQPARNALLANNVSYEIKYEAQVTDLLKQINPQNMWNNLTTITSYKDRYAKSDEGVQAANWFKTQVETIAKNNNRNDVSVYLVSTGSDYIQPSVVAKVGNSNEPGIVIGAHMDTLSGAMSKKPGADDDGSGSVTVLEAARTILSSNMTFKKPIYFIWYAAEEEGLVGSGRVVSEFKNKNIPVAAVLHFDLTGYAHNNEPTMWLIDDYVNKDLSAYLGKLISTYVKQPIKHTKCGYACSDHASWTQAGYPAAIPAESAYADTNPSIHSSRDTMDKLSLTHMTDYLKLATAFAVEMAEPVA